MSSSSAYREALAEAAKALDLSRVLDVLRNYHRIAWLTRRQGPETHRRTLDKAAEIMRTGQNPDAVPIEAVKALISECGCTRAQPRLAPRWARDVGQATGPYR